MPSDIDESTPAERVKRGAVWMDNTQPGWAALVNTETLDMRIPFGPCGCVLSQVFGNFYDIKVTEDGNREYGAKASLGFTDNGADDEDPAWEILADLWRKEIKMRLA